MPTEVKRILRTPSDESRWENLEALRAVVAVELEGERGVILNDEEDIEKLACAVEACASDFADEVGPGSLLVPQGARVCFELPAYIMALRVDEARQAVCTMIRDLAPGATVRVKTRPRRTWPRRHETTRCRPMFKSGQGAAETTPEVPTSWLVPHWTAPGSVRMCGGGRCV